MTTPTVNMNWTDPTVGGSSDAWGDLTNAIWDNLDAHAAGIIYGLTLSAAGSTGTFGIAAGAASGMVLPSAYTKTTASWTLGSGNGSLDTGAIANSTWYHVWLIQRSDTGVVDVLTSLSATSPTMPASYDRKRRIGSMKTDGSAHWGGFTQNGDEFLWANPIVDANNVTPGGTTASSLTLNVPPGVKVNALVNLFLAYASGSAIYALASSLDTTDTAAGPSTGASAVVDAASDSNVVSLNVRTNTSSQIRVRFSATTAAYYVYTLGWIDRRGRD